MCAPPIMCNMPETASTLASPREQKIRSDQKNILLGRASREPHGERHWLDTAHWGAGMASVS